MALWIRVELVILWGLLAALLIVPVMRSRLRVGAAPAFYLGLATAYLIPLSSDPRGFADLFTERHVSRFGEGLIVLVVAHAWAVQARGGGSGVEGWAAALQRSSSSRLPNRLKKIGILLGAFSVSSWVLFIADAGGVTALLARRGDMYYAGSGGNVLTTIAGLGVASTVPSVACLVASSVLSAGRLIPVFVYAAMVGLWFVAYGSRSAIVGLSAVVVSGVIMHPRVRYRIPLALCVVLFLGPVALALEYVRGYWAAGGDSLASYLSLFAGYFNADFLSERLSDGAARNGSEVSYSLAIIEWTHRHGYVGAEPLLEFLTRWVPSAWWPDKPYPNASAFTPILAGSGIGASQVGSHGQYLVGPAAGALGYFYSMGGLPAVALGGVGLGSIHRLLTSKTTSLVGPAGSDGSPWPVLFPAVGFIDAVGTPGHWLFAALPLVLLFAVTQRLWGR